MVRSTAPTFDGIHGGPKVVQVLVEHLLYGGDSGGLGEGPGVYDGRALARQLLAGVGLAEQLLGDLAKVIDEADGCIFLQGIVNAGGRRNVQGLESVTQRKVSYLSVKWAKE